MSVSLADIQQTVRNSLTTLPSLQRLFVAYSGGLDSHLLLYALATCPQIQARYTIHALHVHHNLQPAADEWVSHCQQVAADLQVPITVHYVDPQPYRAQGLEAAARQVRYAALATAIESPTDVLLTAHHQDDQVETVLLQLLRGSGPAGLAGIAAATPFAQGHCLRPLLPYPRAQLAQLAAELGLIWVEDSSNQATCHARNYLRHQVLPLLRQRWPGLNQTITRSASLCGQQYAWQTQLTEQDWLAVYQAERQTLDLSSFTRLLPIRQAEVIRYWLRSQGIALPNQRQLQAILTSVVMAKADAMPRVCWPGGEVRRFRQQLYAFSEPPWQPPATTALTWSLTEPLRLPGDLGILQIQSQRGAGLNLPANAVVTVRFRQTGERFQPQHRVGSHPLKKLFQEWDVPPWERARIPLIYYHNQLVAVVGFALSAHFPPPSAVESGLIFYVT